MASVGVKGNELVVATGKVYKAETSTNPVHIGYTNNLWKVSYEYIDKYTIDGRAEIEDVRGHRISSITRDIADYRISDNFKIFFNLGISYTDVLSNRISSRWTFREELGVTYKDISVFLAHNSNAGLKPPNRGEDTIFVSYNIEF